MHETGASSSETVDARLIAGDARVDQRAPRCAPPSQRSASRRETGAPSRRNRRFPRRAPHRRAASELMRLLAITATSPTAAFDRGRIRYPDAARNEMLHGRNRRLVPADADVERVDAVGRERAREVERLGRGSSSWASSRRRRCERLPESPRRRSRESLARPRAAGACAAPSRRPNRRRGDWSAAKETG